MSFSSLLGLAAWAALCLATAAIGAWLTSVGLHNWYPLIRRPTWTPPSRVFRPVWSALFLAMAVAAWLVWNRWDLPGAGLALLLFLVQLALNCAWSLLFFSLESPGAAMLESLLLWTAIAGTIAAFWRVSALAAALMVPYLAWVTFVAALNVSIWRLNR